MKRSEVIKLIQDTFEFQGTGTTMREKDAESILSALEDKAGILPPDTSSGCGDPECCGGPYHAWDPE
jgi:hypothetical protein